MFKYVAVTLAAFYAFLLVFGDESRRQEVARTAPAEDSFSLSALIQPASASSVSVSTLEPLPEQVAIDRALEAGREYREARSTTQFLGAIPETPTVILGQEVASLSETPEAVVAPEPTVELWKVTGTRVNLRAGPGTRNAVVGQLTLGTEAQVLNQGDGWYQIQTADGAVTGWIFGKFLARKG